jgi:Na+-transporting methylmalonyl-CoA/oxaloacetate decarboxylase gamma subunit
MLTSAARAAGTENMEAIWIALGGTGLGVVMVVLVLAVGVVLLLGNAKDRQSVVGTYDALSAVAEDRAAVVRPARHGGSIALASLILSYPPADGSTAPLVVGFVIAALLFFAGLGSFVEFFRVPRPLESSGVHGDARPANESETRAAASGKSDTPPRRFED